MNRRWLLFVLCLCCALPRASFAEELVLWGVPRQRGLDAAIAHFEGEHPGWHIVLAAAGAGQDPQQLLLAVAGGSPPDLILQDRFAVAQWAARGAFQPLDGWVEAGLRAQSLAEAVLAALRGGADPAAELAALAAALRPLGPSRESALVLALAQATLPASPQSLRQAEELLALVQSPDPRQHYAAVWSECVYAGQTYAVPYTTDARALYYNEELLERAGVSPPADWDALRRAALRLTERDEHGALRRLGFAPNYGNSWLYLYSFLNGGDFLSLDGRRATLAAPAVVTALTFMRDIYDDLGGKERVAAFQSTFPASFYEPRAQELDPFLTGKVVMKIDGNWFLQTLAEYGAGVRFGVAAPPVPAGLPTLTWSGGFSWAIPTGARHPAQAFALIRSLMNDRGALLRGQIESRYARSRGRSYLPTLQPTPHLNTLYYDRLVAGDPDLSPRLKGAFVAFTDLLPSARHRPVTPVGQVLWDEHVRATEQALGHVQSPERALLAAQRRVQEELDRVHRPTSGAPLRWAPVLGVLSAILGCAVIWWRQRARGLVRDLRRSQGWLGPVFASPFLLGFVILLLGPLLASLLYSFCSYDVLHPPRWVGLRNYAGLLSDPLFFRALANTAYMLLGLVLSLALGLALAVLLDGSGRGLPFYRALLYLPTVVPTVASAVLWTWVLNPELGLLNALLRAVGVTDPPTWLQSASWLFGSKAALILLGLWGLGTGMVLWLAGLREIPRQLYEAAELDGASAWQRFVGITLPLLSPQILFQLILGTIGTVQIFAPAYIMTQGGPADSTLFLSYHLFNHAFRYFHMGYASALAWLIFLLILGLSYLQLRLSAKLVHYGGE